MRITITDYKSKTFPIMIIWNKGNNSNVFQNMEQVKAYCSRFTCPVYIDKRKGEKA